MLDLIGELGFDGGVDFIINNKSVDLKTMSRRVFVQPHYVHNFIGYQENYEVDYYIFASYNKKADILTICGYVSKEQLKQRANFYPKDATRYRDDGTSFKSRAPLYEIKQSDLEKLNSIDDIFIYIK